MVSDFILESTGTLVLRDNDSNVIQRAKKIICPGSNGDNWWTAEDVVKQTIDSIAIFNRLFPDKVGLWVYDQSSAHASLPPGAIRPFAMNRGNGGTQKKNSDTVVPENVPGESMRNQVQEMTTKDGLVKGLEQVLKERGYQTDGIHSKCSPVCPAETSQDCCLARMLSRQEDVRSQISMLEAAITCRGHLCIFLPKFHCELNPIEMYWGQTKRKYRDSQESKLTFAHQRALVEKCLDDYSLETLRKYINRACTMLVFFYETSADMCHS